MKTPGALKYLVVVSALLVGSLEARADTVVFDVNNIVFSLTSVNGNPQTGTYYGSAQFTWNYTAANFAGGTGILNYIINPFVSGSSGYPTIDTADLTGITTTLASNVDNLVYDMAINFAPGLTGPTSHTSVSGGNFDLSNIYGGEWVGNITGGTVVAAVPETNTGLMMLIGVGLVGFIFQRKRQSTL